MLRRHQSDLNRKLDNTQPGRLDKQHTRSKSLDSEASAKKINTYRRRAMSEGAIDFKLVPTNLSEQPDVTLEKHIDYKQKRTNPQDFIRLASSQSKDTPSVLSNALRQRDKTYQEAMHFFRQKYHNYDLKVFNKIVKEKKAGDPPDLDVHFARKYLDSAVDDYYEAINPGTPKSLELTKAKLEQLAKCLDNPRNVVSVGVGSGEEVQVAVELFAPHGARIHGLDLSPHALNLAKERLARSDMEAHLVEGSATEMPFKKESIDGFIMSATLHEIYSYIPDGKQAWRQAIREVATKLAENGAFLLRDFAAPEVKDAVTMRMTSDLARQFYKYFREHHRVFASWGKDEVATLIEKRIPNDGDYPPVDEETGVVQLPYARAAEVMLHFRNFSDDYSKGLTKLGDPHWKEINESYLPPHPSHDSAVAMPKQEYIEAVLAEGNKALADTPYMFVCVQDALSGRAEASKFLADHFSLQLPGSQDTSEQLVGGVTNKMELVFKKVRAPMTS